MNKTPKNNTSKLDTKVFAHIGPYANRRRDILHNNTVKMDRLMKLVDELVAQELEKRGIREQNIR